ncbi:MAG: hypothetical protein V3S46_03395 [Nitrospinota bacterium]
MKRSIFLAVAIFLAAFAAHPVSAKEIVPNAASIVGENKVYIKADGLACYFCAYGLERFFRQSGKIASYDIDMKKGIVEASFIKGKPLINEAELNQIVYDAGYTPRSITYELVGQVGVRDGGFYFTVEDTGQEFTLETKGALSAAAEKLAGKTVRMKSKVKESDSKAMVFEPISFEETGK